MKNRSGTSKSVRGWKRPKVFFISGLIVTIFNVIPIIVVDVFDVGRVVAKSEWFFEDILGEEDVSLNIGTLALDNFVRDNIWEFNFWRLGTGPRNTLQIDEENQRLIGDFIFHGTETITLAVSQGGVSEVLELTSEDLPLSYSLGRFELGAIRVRLSNGRRVQGNITIE